MKHSILAAGAAAALALALPAWPQAAPGAAAEGSPSPAPILSEPWYQVRLMPDPILDQVLLFYLGEVYQGMADVGEVLDTVSRVRADDEYSWTREWQKTADRLRTVAEKNEKSRHGFSTGRRT